MKNKSEIWADITAQVDTITDGLGMPIDPKIKPLVIALNALDFPTNMSCEGHLHRGQPTPWISFECLTQKEIDQKYEQRKIKYENAKAKDSREVWLEFHKWDEEQLRPVRVFATRLCKLLEDFYVDYHPPYHAMFVISRSSSSCRIEPIGDDEQYITSTEEKAQRLKLYQQEAQKLAEFTKNKFFNS